MDGGIGAQIAEASANPHGSIKHIELKEGDIVLMDGGCGVDGYRSDISRTIVFGEPSKRQKEMWALAKKAQTAVFAKAGVGVPRGARSTTGGRQRSDDLTRIAVGNLVVEQDTNRGGGPAKDDKLDARVMNQRTVWQRITELEGRVRVWHEHAGRAGRGGESFNEHLMFATADGLTGGERERSKRCRHGADGELPFSS